jgi:hypothetical protein
MDSFDELKVLDQRLLRLEKTCHTYREDAKAFQQCLSFKSNQAALKSVFITDVTHLVLPFALVSGFFSIPGDDMAFKRNPNTFVLAVLGTSISLALLLESFLPAKMVEALGGPFKRISKLSWTY